MVAEVSAAAAKAGERDAFWAGYLLGFHSSLETREVDPALRDEVLEATATWGRRARGWGIAVPERGV